MPTHLRSLVDAPSIHHARRLRVPGALQRIWTDGREVEAAGAGRHRYGAPAHRAHAVGSISSRSGICPTRIGTQAAAITV